MYKVLFFVFLLNSISLLGFAQNDTSYFKEDTLSFFVEKLICSTDSENDTIILHNLIRPNLHYDFINQYPYYFLDDSKIDSADLIQIKINKHPSSGALFIFSLDAQNNITTFSPIYFDSLLKAPFYYPSENQVLEFKYPGRERLVFWYSTDSLPAFEKLAKGIEMTYGSFIYRNNGQILNSVLWPNIDWHFTDDSFGFIMNRRKLSVQKSFILPLIIEVDVNQKHYGKSKRKKSA